MAKLRIKDVVSQILEDFLKENQLELYNSEFVKEGKDWYIRVYIDKVSDNEEESYIDTDDCEKVSRFLSEKLDELDPIEQNYMLEVSSPGIDRQLFETKDYERFAGHLVDVKLYANYKGSKIVQGKLNGILEGKVSLEIDGNNVEFPLEQIAKTNLAVVF